MGRPAILERGIDEIHDWAEKLGAWDLLMLTFYEVTRDPPGNWDTWFDAPQI